MFDIIWANISQIEAAIMLVMAVLFLMSAGISSNDIE